MSETFWFKLFKLFAAQMPRKKATRPKGKQLQTSDPDASIIADGGDKLALKKEAILRDFSINCK